MHKIWPGRIADYVKYENINNSELDGMSLASFCQIKPAYFPRVSFSFEMKKWDFKW